MSDHPENLAYELGWVALGETLGDDDGCEAARAMGEAIVASDEMQAIRQALYRLAMRGFPGDSSVPKTLAMFGLPPIVIEWVLS